MSGRQIQTEFLIIGAGVLGLSLAYHLAQRNRRVVVLERESSYAQHASGKNAGMFRQLYRHPQLTQWATESISIWPVDLKNSAFLKTGSCISGRTSPGHHLHLFRDQEIEGVSCVSTETDGLLDPGTYCRALYQLTDKKTSQFFFNCSAVSLDACSDGGWHLDSKLLKTNVGIEFKADCIINASGAWVNDCLRSERSAHLRLCAQAYARHLFLVHGWPENFMPTSECGYYWDEIGNWYMRLWDKHSRLFSICDQTPGNPDDFTPAAGLSEKLSETISHYLPQQAESLSLGTSWHCFRTYTQDKLPILGQDPDCVDLFWLAAFGGFGMSTSFAATRDAARVLTGEASADIFKDFSPRRARTT